MRLLSSLLAQTRCNSPRSGIKQQLLAGERVAETCKDASQQPSNRGQESIEYASGRAAKARHTSLASAVEEFARVVLWLCVRFLHIDHC